MAKPPDRRDPFRRPVSRDEAELFKSAMRDAKPLAARGDAPLAARGDAPPTESGDAPSPVNSGPTVRPDRADGASARRIPPTPGAAGKLPEIRAGETAGLDRRTMDRLRRGQMRPEARLDLHGSTREEAHRELTEFLHRARDDGKRCVIVITGRGRASFGGGVIRNETPRWLNLPALRPLVLGFAEAQPKDGGAGALYVLLRRRK